MDALNRKLQKACDQLQQLMRKSDELLVRYDRSIANGNASAQLSLAMQLRVVDGISALYYEYCKRISENIELLVGIQGVTLGAVQIADD
jgi:hypothetical protein